MLTNASDTTAIYRLNLSEGRASARHCFLRAPCVKLGTCRSTSLRGGRSVLLKSAFVKVNQIGNGNDIGAVSGAVFLLCFLQGRGGEISPAQFRDEPIPDDQIAPVQLASLFITPFENFFVAPASKHALTQLPTIFAKPMSE